MRHILKVALLLIACTAARAQVDRNAFTFTQYKLDVTVTPQEQALSARGDITLRNDSSTAQRHVVLQISSSLNWTAITVAGAKPAQFLSQPYTSDIDHTGELSEAVVTVPATQPGATIQVHVEYSGTIPRDATRLTRVGLPEARAVTSDWDQIGDAFTAVRGVGYVCWYPVAMDAASLSNGTELFDTLGAWKRREAGAELRVTMTARVRGDRLPQIEGNDQPKLSSKAGGTMSAAIDGPRDIPSSSSRDLVYAPLSLTVPTFAIGAYSGATDELTGTTVSYLPGHESQAREYATTANDVAPLVAKWFGARKQRVRIIELADENAASYDSGAVLFAPLRPIERKALDLILAHQLTHATFDSPRLWIYEGLATFAEALEREQQDGRAGAMDFMRSKLPLLVATERAHAEARVSSAQSPRPGDSSSLSLNAEANSLVSTSDDVYYRTKAMDVWWMLRDTIGDAPLQAALSAYRAADDRAPHYVQGLLESQSKKQLGWFFDDWIYRDRGLPDFRIDAAYPVPTIAGAYGVTVTVENLGGAAAEVPVTVGAAEGQRTARVIVPGKQKAFVRIAVPAQPTEAVVNDGSVPETDFSNNRFVIELTKKP